MFTTLARSKQVLCDMALDCIVSMAYGILLLTEMELWARCGILLHSDFIAYSIRSISQDFLCSFFPLYSQHNSL